MEMAPLKAFLVLARQGHMTRAAAALHLTQPAVSSQLARLEDELGQKLFDRTPKGMVLTEAGQIFRVYVEEALIRLKEGQEALDRLAGLEEGSLSIGGGATATTYLFPSLLGDLHELHPAIRLFVREQGSEAVARSVVAGELDLGVVTSNIVTKDLIAGTGARLKVEAWIEDELILISPPEHPLKNQKDYVFEDLRGEPFVLFEAGSAVRNLIEKRLQEADVKVQSVMELRSIESIKQMVASGIGSAFVSRFALGAEDQGLSCAEGPLLRRLDLVYRTDRSLHPAAKKFLALARAMIQ